MEDYSAIPSLPTSDIYYYFSEVETPKFEIRLSIFFIGAMCVGFPCLIWAFYFVNLQRKTRGRISAFIILLLISDLLQLLLYPYIVSKQFYGFFVPDIFVIVVVFYLKMCSFHLQQLVALEGVLTLKYPQVSAFIFSLPCYIMISLTIFIFPGICVLVMVYTTTGGVYLAPGSVLTSVYLLVVTGIITCKAPPTPASTAITDKRPGAVVFLISTVTLVVLYLPCVLLLSLLHYEYPSWSVMIYCLVSLTVVSEPLLCVLVCRKNLSAQTTQTHIELNTAHTSV